jgi:hypothetical protein
MSILADDDVVVHRDAERLSDVDDRLRHLDVGLARRRIATRIVVHQPTHCRRALKSRVFGRRKESCEL